MASGCGLLGLELGNVESLVDDLWYGLYLCVKFFLDGDKIEAVVVCDEVDGQAEVTEATRASDSVEVSLRGLGEVKVDDDIDSLDVDTTSQQIYNKEN